MDKAAAIATIINRANAARMPIYLLCQRTEPPTAPSTFTRWKSRPTMANWSTIGKFETALDRIESEKA